MRWTCLYCGVVRVSGFDGQRCEWSDWSRGKWMGFLVVMFTLRQDHEGSGSDVGLDSDGCLMGFEEGEKG